MDEELKQFYSDMSGKALSEQEAYEADKNFVGLFELLIKIDKRNEAKKKSSSHLHLSNKVE
jgi:hypothetical protein